MHTYKEHFNNQSHDYLNFRPDYPAPLYDYLTSLLNNHDLVWDVGTGNGQAAKSLSDHFKKVIASDCSQSQLDVAYQSDNIEYYCWPADQTALHDHSTDLITVAQALHWFDLDRFYQEVRRVCKPTGLLAVWCYSLATLDLNVNHLIKHLYTDILGDYWPDLRRFLDQEYKTIPFPFKKKLTPRFIIERQFNLEQLLGYLNTWSAVKEYAYRNQKVNPISFIEKELSESWGDPTNVHRISWPIHLLVGSMS